MTHLEENKLLANSFLEREFYQPFREGDKTLEIYLTAKCKANCKYCYLKQHRESLYPAEIDNYDVILKNFQLILNWYVKNQFRCNLDFFSAEWLTLPIAEPILTMIYDTFSQVDERLRPQYVLGADNMQFLKNPEITAKIQQHIDRLETLNIKFRLSASVDGKYCDTARTECDDDFYRTLFEFMQRNQLLAHPMVAPDNIEHWIENWDWWQENAPTYISDTLMMLEVRNEHWTHEKIHQLLYFLNHVIDEKFNKVFQGNKREFLKYVLTMHNTIAEIPTYNNIALINTPFDRNSDDIPCSFGMNVLCLRVGDLSMQLCHRLSYPELAIGKYNLVDDEITDFEPTNVNLLIFKKYAKRSTMPHCEKCMFVGVCSGSCLGSSYENYHNPMIPVKESCEMFKAKFIFLIRKFEQMGLFEEIPNIAHEMRPEYRQYLENLIHWVLEGGREE